MTRLVLFLALSLSACAGKAPIAPTVCALPLPAELDHAVLIHGDDGTYGWAAPVSHVSALTAAHVATTALVSYRDRFGRGGRLRVIWSDSERDLALLQVEDGVEFNAWFAISPKSPETGDPVYTRGLLPGLTPTKVRAWWMGQDATRLGLMDGWTHPGASGSPVTNQGGQLVGITIAGANWSTQDRKAPGDAGEWLGNVEWRTLFRSVVACRVVVGGMPKARS